MKTCTNYLSQLFVAFTLVFTLVSTVAKAEDEPKVATKSTLANSSWQLVRTQSHGFLLHPGDERNYTINFKDSTLTLASYCNNIEARFSESSCNLKLTGLSLTQRICSHKTMDHELEYMDILYRITNYVFDSKDQKLKFYIGDELVMVMKKSEKQMPSNIVAASK